MEFLYTLCFIKQGDNLLMLNRNQEPWLGIWNGVGGKRIFDESALDCIAREIMEETQLNIDKKDIVDKGYVTWNDDFKTPSLGLHLFFAEIPITLNYPTPVEIDEGILSWKPIVWVDNKENYGVSYNIPYFLDNLINDDRRYHYHCKFKGYELISVEIKTL